ncbi:MAG TPA: extensin family protein [Kofleriaceae bacterium]
MRFAPYAVVISLAIATPGAHADPRPGACLAELDARHVSYRRAARPGIAIGVEILGPLGGLQLRADDQPLVIDCSLAVSLAEAGHYFAAVGIDRAHFVSAYARRNVHGTTTPSKHSYGLAIDISSFAGADVALRVDRDYETGLGDEMDCIGDPQTPEAAALKTLQCELVRSGLFHLVLSPDYDDFHRDHFHLEALPWHDRATLRSSLPAIH